MQQTIIKSTVTNESCNSCETFLLFLLFFSILILSRSVSFVYANDVVPTYSHSNFSLFSAFMSLGCYESPLTLEIKTLCITDS